MVAAELGNISDMIELPITVSAGKITGTPRPLPAGFNMSIYVL